MQITVSDLSEGEQEQIKLNDKGIKYIATVTASHDLMDADEFQAIGHDKEDYQAYQKGEIYDVEIVTADGEFIDEVFYTKDWGKAISDALPFVPIDKIAVLVL